MCLANCPNNNYTPFSASAPKPFRPYTEYNIFFQLEREHILQAQLGFLPEYELSEIFDPSDKSNYQGPPLPSRYDGLVYLKDWHLPGKEKRRKRRHRKTHGMIGFQELSLKIADAWKMVDPETRAFCAELCDIGQTKYRLAMKSYNATAVAKPVKNPYGIMHGVACNSSTVHSDHSLHGQVQGPRSALLGDTEGYPSNNSTFIPTDRCSMEEVDAAFENDFTLSLDEFYDAPSNATISSGITSMIDLLDNEWAPANMVQPVTVVSDFWYSSSQGAASAESKDHVAADAIYTTDATVSDIDKTMADLQNMRNLLNQQIQMYSSMVALTQDHGIESTTHGVCARSA